MSFQQGLSGLNTASRSLDAISNNVANSTTVGFKSSSAQFADVYAASLSGAGSGQQVGIGTTISEVQQLFTQGNITVTNNPLDVAINGQGFFRMSNSGSISYTRNGQFGVDKNGYIVNSAGYRLTGYPADAQGTILQSSPVDIQISTSDLTPKSTQQAKIGLNLDSRQNSPQVSFPTFDPTDPRTFNTSTAVTVFDSLGNPHTLQMFFVKTTTAGTWDVHTELDGAAPTAPATVPQLTFNSSGALTSTPTMPHSFAVTSGATSPLSFTLDFTGSTQFGSTFGVNRMIQDGYSSGRLSGVSISQDGVVQGRYSNGQTRNLGEIVLSNFQNPNGLLSLGGNQWSETAESGPPLVGGPGSGSLGVLQSAAIEESNVDLTAELVSMITQQRAYQANAQSIKTQDQVLQTLVNLR